MQCHLDELRAAGAGTKHTSAMAEGLLDALRIVGVLPLLPETDARDCVMATLQVVVRVGASNASASWAAFGMSGLFELMGRVALRIRIPAGTPKFGDSAARKFEWLLQFLQHDQNASVVLGNISVAPRHGLVPIGSAHQALEVAAGKRQDSCENEEEQGTEISSPQSALDVHSLIESEIHAALEVLVFTAIRIFT